MEKIKKLLWLLVLIPILALGIVVKNVHALDYPSNEGYYISRWTRTEAEAKDFVRSNFNGKDNDLKTITCVDILSDGSKLRLYTAYEVFKDGHYDQEEDEYYEYEEPLFVGFRVFEVHYLSGLAEGYPVIFEQELITHFHNIYNEIQQNGSASDELLDEDFYYNETTEKFQFEKPWGDEEPPVEPPVEDEEVPIINGQTSYVTSISNKVTLEEIKAGITVSDNIDGDITDKLVVESDNYSQSTMLGVHKIVFKVEDEAGNVARLEVFVNVKDVTKPVISGKNTYTLSYTAKTSLEAFKNALTVTDNYDVNVELVLELDHYSENYNSLGTYTVIYTATDTSNNKTTYEILINVVDNIAPEVNGPSTITKGLSVILTLEEIEAQIEYVDDLDTNPVLEVVTDEYTGNGDKIGLYLVVFKITDNSGNSSVHEVHVRVRDDIAPVFLVNNNFLNVDKMLSLTKDDFIQLLINTGQLQITSSTMIEFLVNEYEGNENLPGTYQVTIKASSASGTNNVYEITTIVTDSTEGVVLESVSVWENVKNWFNKPLKEEGKFKVWHLIVSIVGGLVLIGGLVFVLKPKYRFKKRWK